MTHTKGLESRYRKHGESILIELKLRDVMQLFNSLDPAPFHEKDLDDDAVEYIVGSTQEFPLKTPLGLHLHVPPEAATKKSSENVGEAIRNFFEYRTEVADRELCQKLRQGARASSSDCCFYYLASARGRWSLRSATACSMTSSRRGCSSAVGWRCGGRSRSSSTTGGRSAIGASCITS